jgi:hypothetical protein
MVNMVVRGGDGVWWLLVVVGGCWWLLVVVLGVLRRLRAVFRVAHSHISSGALACFE